MDVHCSGVGRPERTGATDRRMLYCYTIEAVPHDAHSANEKMKNGKMLGENVQHLARTRYCPHKVQRICWDECGGRGTELSAGILAAAAAAWRGRRLNFQLRPGVLRRRSRNR